MKMGASILTARGGIDGATELMREKLQSIADAEHRNTELEELRIGMRRTLGVDRCWAT
jgi:hypothetical protein